MAENVRESDSPAKDEADPAREAPSPTSGSDDRGRQVDEHAAMRQTVAREYADALGKRYEPPGEEVDAGEKPRFGNVEIDKSKISECLKDAEQSPGKDKVGASHPATGLTARDADQVEAQIRAGLQSGTPVAGKIDQYGQRWSVDVPVTGPAGTTMARTEWIVAPGSDQPRLTTMSFP